MDKRLVKNYVKHANLHNRILEEEDCWRKHKRSQHRRSGRRRGQSPERSPTGLQRAFWRQRKQRHEEAFREARESISASAEGGSKAVAFWRELVRRDSMPERWAHDGWEELNQAPASLKTTTTPTSSSDSNSDSTPKQRRRQQQQRRRRNRRRSRNSCAVQTMLSIPVEGPSRGSDSKESFSSGDEIVWLERP